MTKEIQFGQHSFEQKNLVSKEMVFFFSQCYFPHYTSKTCKCFASITAQVLLLAPLHLLCRNGWPGGQLPAVSGTGAIGLRHQSFHLSFRQLCITNLALGVWFTQQYVVHLHLTKNTLNNSSEGSGNGFEGILLLYGFHTPLLNLLKNIKRSWKQNGTPRANTKLSSESIHLPCFLKY